MRRELKALPKDLAEGGLAALALALAAEVESAENSATAKGTCARELRETLRTLRELAPPKKEKDKLDQLAERRERRRARIAKAKDLPGP